MTPIKNIIFDYGGVILNIDYFKTVEAFQALGLTNFASLYSQALQTDFFDQLEKGWVGSNEFYEFIRNVSGLSLTDLQIESAWNAIILDMPEHRIRLLEKLGEKYRIFLLSNTNEIHYKLYSKHLHDVFGYHNFNQLFEKAYFSFQVGMKKPDLEIFELVLNENNLRPEETLFIDDSYQQIQGARQAGLITHFLSDGRDVTSLFNSNTGEVGSL